MICYDVIIVTMNRFIWDIYAFGIWCIVNVYLYKYQIYISTIFAYLPNIDIEVTGLIFINDMQSPQISYKDTHFQKIVQGLMRRKSNFRFVKSKFIRVNSDLFCDKSTGKCYI